MRVCFRPSPSDDTKTFVGLKVHGWTITADAAYQGYDNMPELGYEGRFWCRTVTAVAPWGATEFARGPDTEVIARMDRGVQAHDGLHVLVYLARKIQPIESGHQVESERLKYAREGHPNWRLSEDGTRAEFVPSGPTVAPSRP